MDVNQFYQFYELIKEVIPVMKKIAEGKQLNDTKDLDKKINKLAKFNSAGGLDPKKMDGLPSTKYEFKPEDIEKYRVSNSS